jgi:large subunit ribosomal protein L28
VSISSCLRPQWTSLNEARPDGVRRRLLPAARNTNVWSKIMAQVCDICGKGPQYGNNISHAHNVTRRRWSVNLQAVKALVNGASKRIRVCTGCIKDGKIIKATKTVKAA